jgi:hypothetical protein
MDSESRDLERLADAFACRALRCTAVSTHPKATRAPGSNFMCMSESESRGKRLSNAHGTQTEEPSAQTPPSDLSLARRFTFLNLVMRASHCSSARTAQPVMPAELCGANVFLRGLDHPGRGTLQCSRRRVVSAATTASSLVAASAPLNGLGRCGCSVIREPLWSPTSSREGRRGCRAGPSARIGGTDSVTASAATCGGACGASAERHPAPPAGV